MSKKTNENTRTVCIFCGAHRFSFISNKKLQRILLKKLVLIKGSGNIFRIHCMHMISISL